MAVQAAPRRSALPKVKKRKKPQAIVLGPWFAPSLTNGVLRFFLPWQALCSDNRKFVKGYILSAQYRKAKDDVARMSAESAAFVGWEQTDAPVSVRFILTEPNRKGRDLSFSKCTKDGITQGAGVWLDDVQCRDEHWCYLDARDPINAGAWVSIAKLGGLPVFEWHSSLPRKP